MLMQQQQQERVALKLHNPFTLRIGQVFTGFGVGCGIGIGVGSAINLGAVPVLNSVAGDAIGSFSSFRPHVDKLGKKLGIKNIQAGVGCGLGIGHGFGIGITLKPGTVQQLKRLMETVTSAVSERMKSIAGSSASEEGTSNDERTLTVNERKISSDIPSPNGFSSIQSIGSSVLNTSMAATNQRLDQGPTHGEVNKLQSENTILLTLLRHQEQIELLRKENAALKQALAEVEESSSMPKALSDETDQKTCKGRTKCFECRRKGWQRR